MSSAQRFASLIVCLVLVVIGTTPGAPAAEAKSSLVVVLDGSGSMWGRIGAEHKIVAAKRVMREILKDVPDDVALGFVAYGHRRKGDCGDIQTIAPLGTRPAAVAAAVDRIQPTGKTPITTALRHGAGLLGSTDTPSTLVLVSDGIETCKGDPCAVAKDLKSKGVNLVVHTVGFGVGDKAAKQLQCIADAGGGNYYYAKDANQLSTALFAVRTSVVDNKPAPKPTPVPVEIKPQKAKSKVIKLLGPGTIKLRPASWVKMPPYGWHAVDPETGKNRASARRLDQLKVRKGKYQITWRQSEHYSTDVPLTEIVNVPAGKTVEVPVNTGLQLVVPKGMKPPYQWWLRRPGEKSPFAKFRQTLEPQVLPAGRYVLGWRQSEHYSPSIRLGSVEIAPGTLTRHVLGTGIQFVKADWIARAPYFISLVAADGTKLGRWREPRASQLVPPGTYQVNYRQTEHYHSTIPLGEVVVPDKGFAKLTINSGVKFKHQAGAKPPYQAIFVHLDSGKEFIWKGRAMGKWEPVPLPPGRYKLDWWDDEHGSQRMTLLDEFEIEPGALVEFEM